MVGLLRIPPLWMILAAVFIDLFGYGLVIPLLPIAIARLGGGATLVGGLLAGYALIQGICGPILGALSDRYGRRPILVICLLGTAIGYLLLGLADTLTFFGLALLVDAVTGANLSTAQAYVADSTPTPERTRAFGLMGVAFGLGMTAGPALSGLLNSVGANIPALIAAVLAGMNGIFMLVTLPESLAQAQRTRGAIRLATPWRFLRQGLALRRILLPILCVNLAFSGLQSIFPLFGQARFGWDAAAIGLFFAWVGVCAVLTQALVVGRLRIRLADLPLARLGVCLMLILPLLGIVPLSWMLYPIAAIVAVGSNLCIPALASALSAQSDSQTHGRVMGMQQITVNAALIGGPLIAGFAYDRLGPAAPFLIGGIWALIALGVLVRG